MMLLRRRLQITELEPRLAPAAGLVAVGKQPAGALAGKIAYIHAGHGITADNLGSGSWSFQRGETFEIIEDLGNIDQMNFLADYLFRAGATIVPQRPIGHQVNEVVLDNDDVGVTVSGTWTNSTASVFFGSAGDVPYRYATSALTETAYARYRPTIAVAGFYPVYSWATSGSNRSTDQLYRVAHAGGITEVTVNHRRVGNGLVYLGTYYFNSGTAGYVDISNRSSTAGNFVIADMIRFGNGMGSINRGGGISGRPREDEAGLYWIQWHVDRSQGIPSTEYRTSTDDGTATVGASPRYSEYMNRETDGALKDRVFVSYHSNAAGGRGVVALHNTQWGSSATPNQFTLANTLGAEINTDMVAQAGVFEHDWDDNGSNVTFQSSSFAYGEINNSVINNEFDATIVEVAFHDNQLDAELMRDAKVRDAVARATYQGLIKYFRAVDGNTTNATPLPAAVTNVRGESNAIGSVTLNWTAPATSGVLGGAATGYRVYASIDGYSFDGGTDIAGSGTTTVTLSGYDPATPYYFKIVAVNVGGESPASEVLAVLPAGGARRVLIVNGFDRLDRAQNVRTPFGSGGNTIERVRPRFSNSFDYAARVGAALNASRPGLRFDTASNESVINGSVNLANYAAVIWILGEESTTTRTFDATEQAKVEQYIAGGGHLFASGAEIGWDLDSQANGVSFFENTLKANYISDDANTYSVTGAAAGIFNGLSLSFDNGAIDYDAEFADVITPQAGATTAMTYSTGGGAAIQHPGGAGRGKVVLLGFPFETVTTAANRAAIFDRAMNYFGIAPDTTPPAVASITSISPNGTYTTGQTVNITLNFSEAVVLAGTLNVTLNTGAMVAIASFNGTSAAGTYTVQAGQTTADLDVTGLALAGGATLKDLASNPATLTLPASNLAVNAAIIINPMPPTVGTVTVNAGDVQRSRVTSVLVSFSAPVDAATLTGAGKIILTRTLGGPATLVQTGATGANGRIRVAPLMGLVTAVTLTFDNANGTFFTPGVEYGSLADGRWQLSIPDLNYTSPLNGSNLRRLFGDVNADGVTSGDDLLAFGNSFNGSDPTFDFDADGLVSGADLLQFGNRFGVAN
jgi:hypothetical protein